MTDKNRRKLQAKKARNFWTCARPVTQIVPNKRAYNRIYSLLEKNGFAINNVSLGVGSFSMECLETIESDGSKQYNPYTRDTFGIAVKATYAEDADGKPIMIFKNPKTDTGHFKKSQRGCCRVVKTGDGYDYVDGLTWAEAQDSNELRTVFRDGKFEKQFTLDEVRKNLHGGTF